MTRDSSPAPSERRMPGGRRGAAEQPEQVDPAQTQRRERTHVEEADFGGEQPEYMIRTKPTRSWASARDTGRTGPV